MTNLDKDTIRKNNHRPITFMNVQKSQIKDHLT